MIQYQIRHANPRSKWPWRIVRVSTANGSKSFTHKLTIKFQSADAAHAYVLKHGSALDRCS